LKPYLSAFVAGLEARLRRGEHLALYGPRGSGKSTVLEAVHLRLAGRVPCALSPSTRSLDDITHALEHAYPDVDTHEIKRRSARSRLWRAADEQRGVLLLDHLSDVSNAMVGFLRRLHGGVVGALSAVDVERESDRWLMKSWRYGAMSVRMPLMPQTRLRKLLRARCTTLGLPSPDEDLERRVAHLARGRPGWIIQYTDLERDSRYWRDGRLLVSVLCVDTEAAVRYQALEMLRPAVPFAPP